MIRLLILVLVQSLALAGGQVMLKLAMQAMGTLSFTWAFVRTQLVNWWWLGCGVAFLCAGLLWMYILKHYPFSVAYPLASLTYVFGMLAAVVVFHEHVSPAQWIGVLLIMAGCVLIAK